MSNRYNDPTWCQDQVRTDLAATDAKRSQGWGAVGEKPSLQVFNEIMNAQGLWAENFGSMVTRYQTLDLFAFYADAGDFGYVIPNYSDAPFKSLNTQLTSNAVLAVDTGGVYVDPTITPDDIGTSFRFGAIVVNTGGTPEVRVMGADGSALGVTLGLTNTPTTIASVRVNGGRLAVAYDQYLELFDMSDPTSPVSIFVADHGAAVTDCELDREQVYVCGAAGTGSFTSRAYDTSGNPVWDQAHGATLNAIRSDGAAVYVAGNSGTGAAKVRARDISTGAELWNNTAVGAIASPSQMAVDGEFIWVIDSSDVSRLERFTGTVTGGLSGTFSAMCVTPRNLFFGDSSGDISYLTRNIKALQTVATFPAASVGGHVRSMVADGDRLIVGHDLASSATLTALKDPNMSPALYRKRGASDGFQPFRRDHYPVNM